MATVRCLVHDADAGITPAGARSRRAPTQGPGGRQVPVEDPPGYPIEWFEARAE